MNVHGELTIADACSPAISRPGGILETGA